MSDYCVVIPHYNRPQQLRRAISSVLRCGQACVEIIVVDDGSDQIDAEALRFEDPRIQVIRHGARRGGSAARNTGIDAARAPVIAFLDCDDEWLPGKLARQARLVADRGNPRAYLCLGNVVHRRHDRLTIANRADDLVIGDVAECLMARDITLQTSTFMMPTALARELRFTEGLNRHQDWDFLMRAERLRVPLFYDPTPLAIYDITPDPARISNQPNPARATIAWMKSLPQARRYPGYFLRYFITSYIGKNTLRYPLTTIGGIFWIVALDFRLLLKLPRLTFSHVISRLRPKPCGGLEAFLPASMEMPDAT
ncbi:MAG TPA: glycosyltransferase family 2 protein [Rhizomicrobium sp.]|nr:glycosyltransferase family 2 protein [Rhizomicrobium sp.]